MTSIAAAPEAAEPLRPARLERPPVIDGVLDDEAWQRAPRVTGFRTFVPDFGQAMGGDVTTMGVIFNRFVSRRKEHGAWPELDPKAGLNVLTQMYPLQFSGLGRQRVLEVLPAATYGRQRVWTSGRMEAQDSASRRPSSPKRAT